MENILGFFTPLIIYLLVFILQLILPGRWVEGYVNKPNSNQKLRYRLNGIYVFFVVVLLWFLAGHFEIIPFDWLYKNRWCGLAGACSFGLIFSFLIVLAAPSTHKSFLSDFYLGRYENPQLWDGKIDAKMWLYLIGAILLALNALSFVSYHQQTFGESSSTGIFIAAILIVFFVIDYLTFEEVHIYTYDIFAERVGFKLGWGCITFYPYFYAITLWVAADVPDTSTNMTTNILAVIIFFIGWCLARGANMQKYYFKKNMNLSFLGIKPESISDGNKSLLVNGFWGVSRHINYLGEILMACGIAWNVSYTDSYLPWLYPLYYVALLLPRQKEDDLRCEAKYGGLWREYVKRVPYKIIPFIY